MMIDCQQIWEENNRFITNIAQRALLFCKITTSSRTVRATKLSEPFKYNQLSTMLRNRIQQKMTFFLKSYVMFATHNHHTYIWKYVFIRLGCVISIIFIHFFLNNCVNIRRVCVIQLTSNVRVKQRKGHSCALHLVEYEICVL